MPVMRFRQAFVGAIVCAPGTSPRDDAHEHASTTQLEQDLRALRAEPRLLTLEGGQGVRRQRSLLGVSFDSRLPLERVRGLQEGGKGTLPEHPEEGHVEELWGLERVLKARDWEIGCCLLLRRSPRVRRMTEGGL